MINYNKNKYKGDKLIFYLKKNLKVQDLIYFYKNDYKYYLIIQNNIVAVYN